MVLLIGGIILILISITLLIIGIIEQPCSLEIEVCYPALLILGTLIIGIVFLGCGLTDNNGKVRK